MSTTMKKLDQAIETIASFFSNTVERANRQTGEMEEVNTLAYPQERILNGLAYTAFLTLKTTEESIDKAKAAVIRAAEGHRGDEISEKNLNDRIEWAERLQDQHAALSALFQLSTGALKRHSGKEFQTPVLTPRPKAEFMTPALERAKRLTGLAVEAPQTDGVRRTA